MSHEDEIYTRRLKFIITWLALVFIANIIVIMTLEKQNFINTVYFIVITISTVGYGDISPKNAVTRVFIIILLISFLGSLATVSESVISRIVSRNQEMQYKLTEPISLTNHVIILGNHPIAKKLAELLSQRLISVIYLSPIKDDVSLVRGQGIDSYLLEDNPLALLNARFARAMYLLLENDDETIKYSILMKHINSQLLIYALTQRHMKENYFKYLNMTRSYTIERILGNFISVTTRNANLMMIPNQIDTKAKYYYFLVSETLDPSAFFTSFKRVPFSDPLESSLRDGNSLIMVQNSIALNTMNKMDTPNIQEPETIQSIYKRIMIGGYSDYVREVLNHLKIPTDQFYVFTFDSAEKELAEEDGLTVFLIEQDQFPQVFEKEATKDDLVINFFTRLSDSLYVNSVILESKKEISTIQIVNHDFEIEIFLQMGIPRLVQPIISTTRAMLLILLRELKMTVSIASASIHLFEMIIDLYNPYLGKSTLNLVNDGYTVHFVQKHDGLEFEIAGDIHMILEENDSIILSTSLVL